MKNLKGKTALVIGGSRGIGAATVKKLAQNGTNVAFTYHNAEKTAEDLANECRYHDVKAFTIQVDVARSDQIKYAIERVEKKFKQLNILVNNVGVFPVSSIEETTDEDFKNTINTNIRPVFLASRAVIKIMSDNGRIINTGTHLTDRVGRSGLTLYTLSKAAIVGFTRALAHDLGPKGITVNCVQPGPTDTDMNPADITINPTAENQKSATALNRYGEPEEIANTIAFLASPESSYITGSVINVDGGANA